MASGVHAKSIPGLFLNKLYSLQEQWNPTLISCGILYILLYTPVWKPAWTGLIATLTVLLTLIQKHYKTVFIEQRNFLVALLVFFVINIVLSPLPVKATTGAVAILKGLLLYPAALLAGRVMSENLFKRLGMTFTLVNCLLLAALLFWVVDWNNSYLSLMHWSEKHLGNLHNLNNLIFISDLLALTLLLKAKEQRNKLLAGGCLLLLLFASVLVKSEGSSIALAITLLALLALYSRGRWRLLLAGFAILPVILLHLFYMDPDLFSWLTGYHSNTLTIRSGIYQQLLSAWQQHPWSGWGFNTYKYVDETRVNGVKFIYPHHIYLEAMFSLGIAGSAVVLAWIANALRKIDLSRIQQSAVGLLAFLALIYISAKGMSDLKLLSQQTVGWIAVCLGLLHGRTQLLRQEKKSYH